MAKEMAGSTDGLLHHDMSYSIGIVGSVLLHSCCSRTWNMGTEHGHGT